MLRWRLISAAIILAILLVLVWLDFQLGCDVWGGRAGVIMAPIVVAIALLTQNELLALRAGQPDQPVAWITYLGTGIVVALAFVPVIWRAEVHGAAVGALGWPLLAFVAVAALVLLFEVANYGQQTGIVVRLALTIWSVVYLGLLLSFLALLRGFHDNAWGLIAVLSLLVTVKLSDTAAYLVGRTWGRRKLAPRLSPGKTVEGMLGGLGGGLLGALIVAYALCPLIAGRLLPAPIWVVLAFALALTLAGMLGDLAASLIKRDAGKKDSSRWLPGLGGMLDMLDSIIVAAPVAYAFWVFGMLGP